MTSEHSAVQMSKLQIFFPNSALLTSAPLCSPNFPARLPEAPQRLAGALWRHGAEPRHLETQELLEAPQARAAGHRTRGEAGGASEGQQQEACDREPHRPGGRNRRAFTRACLLCFAFLLFLVFFLVSGRNQKGRCVRPRDPGHGV